jgi:hypothetical protein
VLLGVERRLTDVCQGMLRYGLVRRVADRWYGVGISALIMASAISPCTFVARSQHL